MAACVSERPGKHGDAMLTTRLLPPLPLRLCAVLLLCFSLPRPLALAARHIVSHLPGFHGRLPFHLETGYVGVDDRNDVQLFYYFVPSERDPAKDPLLLWLTGGPGCSGLCALITEMGPVKFLKVKYDGTIPTVVLNPHSWTKVASIIFLDSPAGAGFSFWRNPDGYIVGDLSSSKLVERFVRKWLDERPQFISNAFYVAGDSYSGKVVPIVTHFISEGNRVRDKPLVNLKGYLVGNPVTDFQFDHSSKVPFLHGMGIISDELYQSTMKSCEGQDFGHPAAAECAKNLGVVEHFLSQVNKAYILEPWCPLASPRPKGIREDRRSLQDDPGKDLNPPPIPDVECREYNFYLVYYWANNDLTREALNVQKGTVGEWQRCSAYVTNHYNTREIDSVIMYHANLTSRGYRALVYSGDHDAISPFVGTKAWIRSLNFTIVDDWRSWSVDGQVAGYTRSYSNNFTFATVKGAGHTAPEYRPKECLTMLERWLTHKPL